MGCAQKRGPSTRCTPEAMTPAAFRKLALSLEGATEQPHFERTSFRSNNRIFATMDEKARLAMIPVQPPDRCLAVLESDPDVFIDHGGFTRSMGALGIRLDKVDSKFLADILRDAWMYTSRAKTPTANASTPKAAAKPKKAPNTKIARKKP